MRKIIILFTLSSAIYWSCQKESPSQIGLDDTNNEDEYLYCDSTTYQDTLYFDMNPFEILPNLPDSSYLIYKNVLGQELKMNFQHYSDLFLFVARRRCDWNNSHSPLINYYYNSPSETIVMEKFLQDEIFRIEYFKIVDYFNYNSLRDHDNFRLGYKIPNSNSYFSRLSLDLETGEATHSDPDKPTFSSIITLNGKSYLNVYHKYGSKDEISHELHYNKEFGIVGFTDWPDTTLWVLDRIE